MIGRGITLTTLLSLAVAPVALSAKPDDHAVSLTAAPNPAAFSQTSTLSGRVTGTSPAGLDVSLEQDTSIPLGDKFSPAGMKTTSGADGTFTFSVKPAANTQYRAVAKTKPDTTSPNLLVNVRPRVGLKLSDRTPRAGTRVRFQGAVLPAHDGAAALIQRRAKSGRWATVAQTMLLDAGETQSAFSKRVRIRRDGTYRVKVAKDADHVNGYSRRRSIDVR